MPVHAYLHRVDSNVDATLQQGLINLLGEQSFPANVSQWLVQDLVTSGFYDANLQRIIFSELWEGFLSPDPVANVSAMQALRQDAVLRSSVAAIHANALAYVKYHATLGKNALEVPSKDRV